MVHGEERLDGRARVLTTLAHLGPLSRAELARRTRLAPSTVTGLVAGLQADRLVVLLDEHAATGDRGGRPGQLLALHRRTGLVAGVDVGKAHARVTVADLAHRVVAERDAALEPDAAWGDQVAVVQALLTDVLAEAGASMAQVVSVAVGLPGPYRPGGTVDPAILPGWAGTDPARELAVAFGTPVVIGNDANLGALGECMWGAGRGSSDVVYVKVGTGIGAGLVLRDELYVGSGVAGELGHVSVDPRGPRCRCGNRGCLELLAGGAAVLARVPEARTLADVAALAAAGDEPAVAAVGDTARLLGRALGGVVNLLNPQRVVLGGDLAGAGEALLAPLREALADAALASARDDLAVVTGLHGARAEVLGAVALALRSSQPLSS